MDTVAAFVGKVQSAGPKMEARLKASVGQASLVVKKSVLHAAGTDRLRGVGKKGAKIGVRYRVTSNGTAPSSLLGATGPWQLIEHDTIAHVIERKTRGRRRASGRTGVVTPYGVFARVQHPGTRGKRPFERGVNAAVPDAQRVLRQGFNQAMRGVFG